MTFTSGLFVARCHYSTPCNTQYTTVHATVFRILKRPTIGIGNLGKKYAEYNEASLQSPFVTTLLTSDIS